MSIELVTLGCRLNIVESDRMRQEAAAAGHRDLTIVNTCAVTAEAARQSRQAVRRAARERPGARVIATGCAAQTEAAHYAAMPEIAALVPNQVKTAPETWRALPGAGPSADTSAVGQTSAHTRGFVEVQNGCDHRCTFCIIPLGRGLSRSIPADAVVGRVRALVEGGVHEIVLTGVDVTSYRSDDVSLGGLVRTILRAVPDLPRLRLSSLDCIEADAELVACFADEPRLMPHLHLSLQAGADPVLKRMARRHRRADAIAFCRAVKAARPDVALGADFIAGFPGETDAQFAETLDLIDACDIAFVHAFPYSARPGTPAARMSPVPQHVVRERAASLRAAGQARLARHLDRQVGRTLRVLTERGGMGHAEDFTRVRLPPDHPAGMLVRLAAQGHDGHALTVARPGGPRKISATMAPSDLPRAANQAGAAKD